MVGVMKLPVLVLVTTARAKRTGAATGMESSQASQGDMTHVSQSVSRTTALVL